MAGTERELGSGWRIGELGDWCVRSSREGTLSTRSRITPTPLPSPPRVSSTLRRASPLRPPPLRDDALRMRYLRRNRSLQFGPVSPARGRTRPLGCGHRQLQGEGGGGGGHRIGEGAVVVDVEAAGGGEGGGARGRDGDGALRGQRGGAEIHPGQIFGGPLPVAVGVQHRAHHTVLVVAVAAMAVVAVAVAVMAVAAVAVVAVAVAVVALVVALVVVARVVVAVAGPNWEHAQR
eukprot:7941662-Pyramimonas_sp.AAC.1